jgi:hypothetical protein
MIHFCCTSAAVRLHDETRGARPHPSATIKQLITLLFWAFDDNLIPQLPTTAPDTTVYTLSSRCKFNQQAGSAEEDVGDERHGDRAAGTAISSYRMEADIDTLI